MRFMPATIAGLLLAALAAGCGARTSPAKVESIDQLPTLQVVRVDPSLKGQRYSVLLNFELPSDDAFVRCEGAAAAIDASRAMTGLASLKIPAGARSVAVKLGSLLQGRDFPASWTLLGASFFAEKPTQITATLRFADGRSIDRAAIAPAGQWSAVWVDLTTLDQPVRPEQITFAIAGGGAVWMDDVLMTDNTQWYVGASAADEPWSVCRRGYSIALQSPGKFRVTLDTAQGKATGWTVEEAGALRARFSSSGATKFLTVYSDGRTYWDGEFRGLSVEGRAESAGGHASPAAISVPAPMGRVNRRTAGDENNDAYNERLGAYQVAATGARIDVTIAPRSAVLWKPVLEISGLPQGRALVTVEGQLVESLAWLPDGNLLVVLPFRIDRTTTVNVRVN